jgi:hypothetical protein
MLTMIDAFGGCNTNANITFRKWPVAICVNIETNTAFRNSRVTFWTLQWFCMGVNLGL